jgi:hypothetical protein
MIEMWTEPGVATAKKMKKMMEVAISQSLTEPNRQEVDSLLDLAAAFEYFTFELIDATPHIERLTDKKFKSIRQAPREVRWSLRLAGRHNTLLLAFFDIWRELGQALRALLCANYDSVPRSLRWMIETCIFWADMQLDQPSAQELFENYYSQKDLLTPKEFKRASVEIHTINETRLEERLTFKEKFRGPSVNEIMRNLAILKTTPVYQGHILKEALAKYHRIFSGYAHATLLTAKEISMEPGTLHGDFAFFQDHRYDKERFDEMITSVFRTVDVIISVIILAEMAFYGYDGPMEFFQSLKDTGKDFASKVQQVKDAFPFTWEIVRGLHGDKRSINRHIKS